MPDPSVIVGKPLQPSWENFSTWETRGGHTIREITMEEATTQIAHHFNCTPEDARESLLKWGYASEPNRHWAVKTDKITGSPQDRW